MTHRGTLVLYCIYCRVYRPVASPEASTCPSCGRIASSRRCTRCGYTWYPKSVRAPKTCPSCRSPYWCYSRVRGTGTDKGTAGSTYADGADGADGTGRRDMT